MISKHVSISFPVIEIHWNVKSRGAGASAKAGRHRLRIDPRRSKNNKSLISLTMKVSLILLMIRTPDDLKGLKIRTMENPAHMAMERAMGASPTPITWGEVYMALQQGVVDGQENPVSVIQVAKFNEVQKYLTLDGHVYSILPILINDKFFSSLSPDVQKIIADTAKIMVTISRGQNVYLVANGVKSLQDKGHGGLCPDGKKAPDVQG